MYWVKTVIEKGLRTCRTQFDDEFEGFRQFCINQEKETDFEVRFQMANDGKSGTVTAECMECHDTFVAEIKEAPKPGARR